MPSRAFSVRTAALSPCGPSITGKPLAKVVHFSRILLRPFGRAFKSCDRECVIHEGFDETLLVKVSKKGRVILDSKALTTGFRSSENFGYHGIVSRDRVERTAILLLSGHLCGRNT